MGFLDIDDLTIGYSSAGAKNYVEALNTKAITETNTLITTGITDIKASLRSGWQGDACEAYIVKLEESGVQLSEALNKMKELFEATLAVQEETYEKQDQSMAQSIGNINVFGGN